MLRSLLAACLLFAFSGIEFVSYQHERELNGLRQAMVMQKTVMQSLVDQYGVRTDNLQACIRRLHGMVGPEPTI